MAKRQDRFKIKLVLDGLILYESDYPEREIRNFRFFNNTFVLLCFFKSLEPNQRSLESMITSVTHSRGLEKELARNLPPRRKFFKIVTSLENKTISVAHNLLQGLESKILRIPGLRLDIKSPNLEFLFLLRREGYGFFGVRITYPYDREGRGAKGELRKEIAHIMSILSDPQPKDSVLDPFAGHGSIPLERQTSFPYQAIFAVEHNRHLFEQLKRTLRGKNIHLIYGDALSLREIKNTSIGKIITDPPWGVFTQTNMPLADFYSNMLKEFLRVLKRNGIIVILIGQTDIFEGAVQKFPGGLELLKKYNLLVSGKKATLYKLRALQ